MEIITEKNGNVTVVTLAGENLVAGNAKQFKQRVMPIFAPQAKILFDLARLKFVDSTGLGVMVSCLRQATAAQGDLRLCSMSKSVRALFELVRMHKVFEIYNTRDEALNAFRA